MAPSPGTPTGDKNNPSGNGFDPEGREAADYIASLLEGLRGVALNAEMPFLAYLITLALEEARSAKIGSN